ncbi:DVU0772 family protein [Mailhella sp.]|uniref:DVU0772 family protein n=1 Tax=Mailhella sp. TaxID=1981029 RepID=UPI004063E5EB
MQYSSTEQLRSFSTLPIDWNLDPADAVTLYLEWGNNDWRAEHPPVRSKDDFAHYFVLDNWTDSPTLRLVMRNSEATEDLWVHPLPHELHAEFEREFGSLKGVFMPSDPMKDWLRDKLYAA